MAHYEKFNKYSIEHQFKHDTRENTEKRDRIDKERTYLNYNLCDIEDPIKRNKELIEMVKNQGGRIRKDSVYMCSLIITLPKDFPRNKTLQEQFFKSAKRHLDKIHGKENCLSCWIHLDEAQPHMHYRFCPIKYDKEKNKYKLCAKEILNRNFLKSFHKDLEKEMEEELGFKVSVLNGATKDGHKEIEELIEISEQQKKNREIIDKDSDLILAEQKKMLDEKWKQYQNETRNFWNELNPIRQRIKNSIWEYKKGDRTAQRQIERDLDFIGNIFRKGVLFALISLLNGLMLYTRQKIYQKHIDDLKAVYEDLEDIRRTFSNQQHNTKEDLKSKDFERIDDTLNRLEKTSTTAHELIREALQRMPDESYIEPTYQNDLTLGDEFEL